MQGSESKGQFLFVLFLLSFSKLKAYNSAILYKLMTNIMHSVMKTGHAVPVFGMGLSVA